MPPVLLMKVVEVGEEVVADPWDGAVAESVDGQVGVLHQFPPGTLLLPPGASPVFLLLQGGVGWCQEAFLLCPLNHLLKARFGQSVLLLL